MSAEVFSETVSRPTDDEIEGYKKTKSTFSDYVRFEDVDSISRSESRQRFVDGIDYVPQYNYPKLRFFKDDQLTIDKKGTVQQAIMELEVARKAAEMVGDEARAAELELHASFHDVRLKKIMLVEAAQHLHDAGTSSVQEVARATFMKMNQEVYGEMHADWYLSMIGQEQAKLDEFVPRDENAAHISEQLKITYEKMGSFETTSEQLLTAEELEHLQRVVLERYGAILSAIPDTEDDIYYDAQECAQIINDTLLVGGLADKGWKCQVDSAKSNPATNGAKKLISLPTSTRRNASELRRLVVHEQEVHARRAQNGKDADSSLLASGTADYADVEEGLGVMLECAVEGNLSNPSFKRARERYITAGLALGIDGGEPRDARGVYEVLWRMIAVESSTDGTIPEDLVQEAQSRAFAHVENAFRGTGFWMRGAIYTKLKVYYEGLVANASYIRENIGDLNAALDVAMVGKINHTDAREVELTKQLIKPSVNNETSTI